MNNAPDTLFSSLMLRADDQADGYQCALETLRESDLPSVRADDDVMVAVEYSSVNYKDALAITNRAPVVRQLPLVPGIDLAGTVLRSDQPGYAAGDRVLATGWGLGEKYWGGLSQRARLPAEWLLPVPDRLSSRQAMALGTAGLTAMLCVLRLERAGIRPGDGPVLVSGASGGVGSVAVALLAARGFEVSALSGRPQHRDYLLGLGATEVVPRDEFSDRSRPLEKQRWAAAVDSSGGDILAGILSRLRYGGSVAACGLAADTSLKTTVMPFILRGVSLLGVDSVYCPAELRREAWDRLAAEIPQCWFDATGEPITLEQVATTAKALLAGEVRGRAVVRCS